MVGGVELPLLLGVLVPDLAGLLRDVRVEEEELVVHGADEVEGVVGPPADDAHALREGEALLETKICFFLRFAVFTDLMKG